MRCKNMNEEENPDDDAPVTERLCKSRRQTIEEKFDGLKKCIYVAFTVSMVWITILELVLRYYA